MFSAISFAFPWLEATDPETLPQASLLQKYCAPFIYLSRRFHHYPGLQVSFVTYDCSPHHTPVCLLERVECVQKCVHSAGDPKYEEVQPSPLVLHLRTTPVVTTSTLQALRSHTYKLEYLLAPTDRSFGLVILECQLLRQNWHIYILQNEKQVIKLLFYRQVNHGEERASSMFSFIIDVRGVERGQNQGSSGPLLSTTQSGFQNSRKIRSVQSSTGNSTPL